MSVRKDASQTILAAHMLSAVATTATTNTGTEKAITCRPRNLLFYVDIVKVSAGKSVVFVLKGRDKTTDAFTTVYTSASITAAGLLRFDVDQHFLNYQVVATTAGTFGAGDEVAYSANLIGDLPYNAPIVQVD